ncbi:MAG: hypothetical protein RLY86_993 [Pseudomonadota bacterium]|jgi:signal transduction histidine kinase
MKAPGALRRRIITAVLAYGLGVCALFGGVSFLFAFVVEDAFFARMLAEEVARQQTALRTTGQPLPPLRGFVSIHLAPDTLPPALRTRLTAAPMAEEAAGDDGLHYHILRFVPPGSSRTAYAVAEVSRDLVVRPLAGEILTLLTLLSFAMAAVATVLAVWLGRRATGPLTRLAGQVAAAGPDGLPRRLADGIPPGEEIHVLASSLDGAMARIATLIEREKAFTRDASHELRTPLAVIRANADLLAGRADRQPPEAAALARIARACRDMERTLDLLLTLARDADHRVAATPVRLGGLVERAVVDLPEGGGDPPVEITVTVPDGCTVQAPAPVLAIILANLIGNAVRHGGGAPVSITWAAPWLEIRNGGPGLSPAVAASLFQPGAKGTDSPGWGLGLSIVKRLCDRHGLDLEIAEPAEGGVLARVRLAFTLV